MIPFPASGLVLYVEVPTANRRARAGWRRGDNLKGDPHTRLTVVIELPASVILAVVAAVKAINDLMR